MEFFLEAIFYILTVIVTKYIIIKFLTGSGINLRSGFKTRIPEEECGDIYLIKSSKNYIDVYYGNGDKHKQICYKFSDAVLEMPPNMGIQIHRSYWVSRDSIKTLKSINNKYYIIAKNREEIPVSKTYMRTVKELKKKL